MREQFSINIHHPILKNHRVYDRETMPGLAYIDLLYQIFREHGYIYTAIELRNLTIYNPLTVQPDYEVLLTVQCVENGDDQWQIRVEGQEKHNETLLPDRKLYVTAEMKRRETVVFTETIDLNSLKHTTTKVINISEVYGDCQLQELVHTGIMKADGLLYDTDTALIADISIGQEAWLNTEGFMFHPTLMDGSGIATGKIISSLVKGEQNLYLPLFFQSFCASSLLTKKCITRIQHAAVHQEKELIHLTMEFFNEYGQKIGELQNFIAKVVRDAGLINPNRVNQQFAIETQSRKPASAVSGRPGMYCDNTAQFDEVQIFLRQLLADRLQKSVNLIDSTIGYYEMGLDSARLLEIVHQIETSLQVVLSPTLLFEYTTIDELAAYIQENYSSEFRMSQINPRENQFKPVVNGGLGAEHSDFAKGLPSTSNRYVFQGNEAFLQDHLVFDKPALMGITHPCLALETYLHNNLNTFPVELKNIEFTGGPVTLKQSETAHIEVQFDEFEGQTRFQTVFYITDPQDKRSCCQGELIQAKPVTPQRLDISAMLEHLKPLDRQELNGLYQGVKDFKLGEMLKTIDIAYLYNDTLISKVNLSGKLIKGNVSRFIFDPLLLNSCYYIYQKPNEEPRKNIFIPLMIESLTVYRPMTEKAYVLTTPRLVKDDFISIDAKILTEDGEAIAFLCNASIKEVVNPSLLRNASFGVHADHSKFKTQFTTKNREEKTAALDIAIIGVAGRYPQAYDIEEFWSNLKNGQDCITEIPKERWDWQEYYTEERTKPGYAYSKWGGFIDDVDRFDPRFFNISPREAERIDPQERLFLEHCWKALEDAGYTRAKLHDNEEDCLLGQVGVYVGVMSQEYPLFAAESTLRGRRFGLGTGISSIANRVSYFLDSHGPSIALDTMCSSSLTCIYMACQALKDNHINLALAGGVNVTIHPNKYLMLSQGQFISSKGHCESFGEGGDGYIPGEGVGVLVLKRLTDAKRDNDHIYGVIKGVAINHGGRTSGYTVPNQKAQSRVIASALKSAHIHPRTISYLEAHGTGTSLGDPIEISGLVKAFREYTDDNQYCALGSVKSNIGHCESAASVAGIIKVLLQLKHGKLVPSLHSQKLNPNIDFTATPFSVQQELAPWQRPTVMLNGETRQYPRIAGISSFGAGGSNAHVVIEEYIPGDEKTKMRVTPQQPAIIVLSAKNEERLRDQVRQLGAAIRNQKFSDADLADMAYTLQIGREAMEERLALSVLSLRELEEKLQHYLEGKANIDNLYRGKAKRNQATRNGITPDDELQAAMEAFCSQGQCVKLFELWVKGYCFDWDKLYSESKPCRISLPTYPFARERYWISNILEQDSVNIAVAATLEVPAQAAIRQQPSVPWNDTDAISAVSAKPGRVSLVALSESIQNIEFTNQDIKEVTLMALPNIETRVYQEVVQIRQEQVLPSSEELASTLAISEEGVQLRVTQATITLELLWEELKTSLAAVLGMQWDEIDEDREFVDMGLDSITGVEWIQAINKRYGTAIQATRIYDYPSIKKMANYLIKILVAEQERELISTPAVQTRPIISLESLQDELKISLAEVLGMQWDEIDEDREFVDMGLDSITGVEWIQAMNKRYGTAIQATRVYDYPSILKMAKYLQKQLSAQKKEIIPARSLNSPLRLSLSEILYQVKNKMIDSEEAERLLQKVTG